MRGQVLKGHLEMLVLAVLADGRLHGYAVIEQLRRRSDDAFDLPEGTVYPVLRRLEDDGLLTSEWSEVGGRRRRTYGLSEAGRGALAEQRSAWAAFTGAVERVIGHTPRPVTP